MLNKNEKPLPPAPIKNKVQMTDIERVNAYLRLAELATGAAIPKKKEVYMDKAEKILDSYGGVN